VAPCEREKNRGNKLHACGIYILVVIYCPHFTTSIYNKHAISKKKKGQKKTGPQQDSNPRTPKWFQTFRYECLNHVAKGEETKRGRKLTVYMFLKLEYGYFASNP
jgi:hypothetical protein